jgi:hypothetical protein
MRRVWMSASKRLGRTGVRRAAILVPGVAGLLAAAVMSATAATAPAPSPLSANGVLGYPSYLSSPDGHFHLVMTRNGDLVETLTGIRWLWSSGTSAYPGARALMQVNGRYRTATGVSVSSKGTCPVSSSQATMPSEYRSVAGVRSPPSACSGDM